MRCRHCAAPLALPVIDLGVAPPSNAYRRPEDRGRPEVGYPLRVLMCTRCWLAQTEDYARADELFDADYAYFSSTSTTWLDHAARYCAMARERFGLNAASKVIEVASNDGYLLKNFVAAGVPCLGIEPTAGTAAAAEALGIPVLRQFFGRALGARLAAEGGAADLVIGNNVFAHVPDVNDFAAGLAAVLKPGGTLTLEFPHLLELVRHVQFDTIYHEHYSYLSLASTQAILGAAGLVVVDVERLPTHGGSLRIYARHAKGAAAPSPAVAALAADERAAGLFDAATWSGFQAQAEAIRDDLLLFLIGEKRAGRRVAGYGAAAKGNTLLNFAGVKPDLLPYVCDAAPSKQGKCLPGSQIPIRAPQAILDDKPDVVLILPWNIAAEVEAQLAAARGWGGRFATAIPHLAVR